MPPIRPNGYNRRRYPNRVSYDHSGPMRFHRLLGSSHILVFADLACAPDLNRQSWNPRYAAQIRPNRPRPRHSSGLAPGGARPLRVCGSSDRRLAINLDMVMGIVALGSIRLDLCKSVLIVSGWKPWVIAGTAMRNQNEPLPCPVSNIMPRSRAWWT